MEDVIAIVRALVVSKKEINVNEVASDFNQVEGYSIPYKQFGFNRLESFLESSGQFSISRDNRITVRKSAASAHISDLVAHQRRPKRKTKTIPQRKPNSSQNLRSFAYSNAYSRRSTRSASKHVLQSRLTSNRNDNNIDKPSSYNNNNSKPSNSNNVPRKESAQCDNRSTNKPTGNHVSRDSNDVANIAPLHSKKENIEPKVNRFSSSNVAPFNDEMKTNTKTDIIPLPKSIRSAARQNSDPTGMRTQNANNIPNKSNFNDTKTVINNLCTNAQRNSTSVCDDNNQRYKTLKQSVVTRLANIQINGASSSNAQSNEMSRSLASRLKITPTFVPNVSTLPVMPSTSPFIPMTSPFIPSTSPFMPIVSPVMPVDLSPKIPLVPLMEIPITRPTFVPRKLSNNTVTVTNKDIIPNVIQLEQFCREHNLGKPVFKLFKLPVAAGISCRVEINQKTYSTYPNEYSNERDAKDAVANIALRRLEKSTDLEIKSRLCMDSESELAIKVYESIKSHTNGIFTQYVPEYFEKMYNQTLPNDWLTLIENSPQLFSLECVLNDLKIIYANTVTADDLLNVSNVSENDFQSMDKLILPWTDKYWNIFITNPLSTVEIWGRLVGPEYSDKMDALIIDIELSLLSNKQIATDIEIGCIYLVTVLECTYRVRVDRKDHMKKRCLCFYIDSGDTEWFPLDSIFVCENRFFKFPAQAICFSLYGLEDFAENPHAKQHLENSLLSKILIGDIMTTPDEYSKQEQNDETIPKIFLGIYDTSSDEDICLNQTILKSICNDTEPPTLNTSGISNVTITHIDDKGDIYCQLANNRGLTYIEKIIHHLTEIDLNGEEHGIKNGNAGGLFLVFDELRQKWYRAHIKHISSTNRKCRMFYVDYGIEQTIPMANVYPLDTLSRALSTYPNQAIHMKLNGLPNLNANMVSTLKGYLSANTSAIVKVITNSIVPEVNIYKQFEKSSPLSCINEAIKLEEEINNLSEIMPSESIPSLLSLDSDEIVLSKFRFQEMAEKKVTKNSGTEHFGSVLPKEISNLFNFFLEDGVSGPTLPLGCQLKECQLPKINETFNVLVTMCSNPSNFSVVSYNNYSELYNLMASLQVYGMETDVFIDIKDVEVGQAYAGLHIDGNWYRVVVENDCTNDTVPAYCCDYGEFQMMHKLKVLPDEFAKLPKQALKASLYGIKPINKDWEIEDCLYFQKLISGKNFASSVRNISDNNNKKIELILIDVTTTDDVNINNELVNEGRARFC